MAKFVANNDAVSNATLNSLGEYDAVAVAGATASGRVYATVGDALTAGHRAIAVCEGASGGAFTAGFTVSQSGVRIVGIRPPGGGNPITSGVRVGGPVVISGSYVTIEGLGVQGADGHGFEVSGGHVTLRNCAVTTPTGQGILVSGTSAVVIDRCRLIGGTTGQNAIVIIGTSTSDTWDHVIVRDCWIWDWLGYGVNVGNYSASDTTAARFTLVDGNTIRDCGNSWGAGIGVDSFQVARITGNTVFSCGASGSDANGIWIAAPSASPAAYTTVTGNQVTSNLGYGIMISSASARVLVAANTVSGNGLGQYANCASCPGYASGNTNLV